MLCSPTSDSGRVKLGNFMLQTCNDGSEMYKKESCTCKAFFGKYKPISFCHSFKLLIVEIQKFCYHGNMTSHFSSPYPLRASAEERVSSWVLRSSCPWGPGSADATWVKSLVAGTDEKEILWTQKAKCQGGGGYSSKFYTGRLSPEVQPLDLLQMVQPFWHASLECCIPFNWHKCIVFQIWINHC